METKKSIGKLYEKFEMVKNFSHQLEVAIAQNHLTGQEEFVIVWSDPNDEDRKMPLAQLLTGTEIQEYLEPDFTKSQVANELFKMYSKYETRQTVEELDDFHEFDRDYSSLEEEYKIPDEVKFRGRDYMTLSEVLESFRLDPWLIITGLEEE